MSKKAEKTESTGLATTKPAGLPTTLFAELEQDALNASGHETVSTKDCAPPFLMILQAMSPRLRDNQDKGAREGDFFNTVTGVVVKPPIQIISCAFKSSIVEWKTRENGGGFVAEHTDEAIKAKATKNIKNQDILPNGNQLVDTATHFCLLVKPDGHTERVILSFTSTQLKKSRRWNSQLMSQQVTLPSGKIIRPPRYAFVFEMKTVRETNKQGSWMSFEISNPVLLSDPSLYTQAKLFYEDVTKGNVKVEPASHDDSETVAEPVEATTVM